jgi:hypothetical protein
MTPYLSGLAVNAAHDLHMSQAWFIAALSRQKKLPELKRLLSKRSSAPALSDKMLRLKDALSKTSHRRK